VYLCAGFSKPKFMIDSTEEEFKGVCPLLLIFISSLSDLRPWIDGRLGGRLAIYDADDRD
jgi:hypothetical protein